MAQTPFITIGVDGEDQYNRAFSRLDAVFDDLRPIWPDVRDAFWQIEREQFESEGSKGASGKWAALSARYKRQKIRQYGAGKKILEASGALKASLTSDAPGSYYSANEEEMAVGSTIPYGIYHQRGGKNLKQRKPISLSDAQKKMLDKTIQKSLISELRKGTYYVPASDREF